MTGAPLGLILSVPPAHMPASVPPVSTVQYLPGGTRLPSPPQINSSVSPSVCKITFSAENCLDPTDLVNKYVKIVNRRGIVSQIFFEINLDIMILAKIRVITYSKYLLNSLTAIRVLAGSKNSRPIGFLL